MHKRAIGIAAAALMIFCSLAHADFQFYKGRSAERFAKVERKPFSLDKDVVTVVMREGIPRGGGYTYQYPRENPEPFMTDKYSVEGDMSMEIELIADDYSGAAVCIAGTADLSPHLEEGAVEFWIKGEKGGEIAMIALLDDGVKTNGESMQVKMRMKSFGDVTTEWKKFIMPLKGFGEMGVYWDAKNAKEVTLPFNYKAFKGFRIEVRKGENQNFRVWVDGVVIRSVGPEYEGPAAYPFRNVL